MNGKEDQHRHLDSLATKLHSLAPLHPPDNLAGRILQGLPEKRSLPDRLACTLRVVALSKASPGERQALLPSDPVERGLFLLLTGLFFLVLSLIVLFRLHVGLSIDGYALSLAPACLAAVVLVKAGWNQLESPRAILASRPALVAACCLFGLTAVMGAIVPARQPLDIIALWIGLSGLVTMGGLSIILKLAGDRFPLIIYESRKEGFSRQDRLFL